MQIGYACRQSYETDLYEGVLMLDVVLVEIFYALSTKGVFCSISHCSTF